MPMLFSMGMHPALMAAQERLTPGERIFAFLDDVCVVCHPERVETVVSILAEFPSGRWENPRSEPSRRGACRHDTSSPSEQDVSTLTQWCGEEMRVSIPVNGGSKFWVPRLAATSSRGLSCTPR